MFSSPRCLFIFVAMLLVGCEVVITPADTYDPEYYAVEETEVQPSIEITTQHDYCGDDYYSEKPYYSPSVECSDYYEYYSGVYEGTCCKWDIYDGYYYYREEYCNWQDECLGWNYTGTEIY